MITTSLDELRTLIETHAGPGATQVGLIPNLLLGAHSGPTLPCQVVVEPVFSLVAQGAKRIAVGGRTFDYRTGQFLIVSVDLPAEAWVVEATPDCPYFGCGLTLRPEAIAGLLLESGGPRTSMTSGPASLSATCPATWWTP